MTPEERKAALKLIYRHTHKDYKGKIDGKPSILVCRGGTCLVMLEDLTDAEIADKLPSAQRMEAKRREKRQ